MNYEEVSDELYDVIKSSEQSAVNILEKLELALSFTKEKESYDLVLEIISMIQEEDIFRQKLERVVNSVCENQNIDVKKYNIAPSAKHISGDNYDELSQEDIDRMFQSNNK